MSAETYLFEVIWMSGAVERIECTDIAARDGWTIFYQRHVRLLQIRDAEIMSLRNLTLLGDWAGGA